MLESNWRWFKDSDPYVPEGRQKDMCVGLTPDGGAWFDLNDQNIVWLNSEQLADLVGFIFRGHQSE